MASQAKITTRVNGEYLWGRQFAYPYGKLVFASLFFALLSIFAKPTSLGQLFLIDRPWRIGYLPN